MMIGKKMLGWCPLPDERKMVTNTYPMGKIPDSDSRVEVAPTTTPP